MESSISCLTFCSSFRTCQFLLTLVIEQVAMKIILIGLSDYFESRSSLWKWLLLCQHTCIVVHAFPNCSVQ